MTLRNLLFCFILLLVFACKSEAKISEEITNIPADFIVERFDNLIHNAKPSSLPQLKSSYPYLFSKHIPDSVWVAQLTDSLQRDILQQTDSVFSNFKTVKADIKLLFQHLKFYNPGFKIPRVITLTNTIDYRNKAVVTDSLVLIALDNFLGKSHPYYANFPRYIAKNLSPKDIVPELATQFAMKSVTQQQRRTFLDEMIYFGKVLYFKEVMIPFVSDAQKIGYTEDELAWAGANESPVWSYFIEKELLFSTNPKLASRFLANAPYSKFYLELDNQTPGRIGQYIGWQIVKAYASKTNANLASVLQADPETIFKTANFKPKK